MKQFFFILLAILSLKSIAQDYSTINFFSSSYSLSIYINEQNIGNLAAKESLQYKVYSEGRLEILFVALGFRTIRTVDVKVGETYFFEGTIQRSEKKGINLLAKKPITITAEENKNNPLIVSKTNSGPKQGTCFLISNQGYLLTNYHVISNAKSVQVKGIGNDFSTLYGVDVVAFDVDLDLALLKLKNKNMSFEPVPYGLSLETSSQGTKSFTLGYPLTGAMGEEIKVTEGIISARSGFKGSISQYQFSAAVQPGNSGSPLFSENGDVIGVVNAKLKGAEGAGYAIKSQYVSTFLKLIDNIQIKNNKSMMSNLSLSEKITLLKNNIFIVMTE